MTRSKYTNNLKTKSPASELENNNMVYSGTICTTIRFEPLYNDRQEVNINNSNTHKRDKLSTSEL